MGTIPNTLADLAIWRAGIGVARKWYGTTAANLAAAKAAAISGDTVIVGPGAWPTTASLAKDGVNWHVTAGATITGTNCYIFDASSAMSFAVSGDGRFAANALAAAAGVLHVAHASADVRFEADSMSVAITDAEAGSAVIHHETGRLAVDANYIDTTGQDYCIWWILGDCYIRARRIRSASGASQTISAGGPLTPTGKLWIEVDELVNTSTSVGCIATDNNADPTQAVWVFAKEIRSAETGTSQGAIDHRGGKLYVSCQKIFAVKRPWHQVGSTSTLWLDAQKVEASLAADLTAGSSWVRVSQFLDNGATPTELVSVSGGTHNLNVMSMERTGAGNGFAVSGGTLNLRGKVSVTSGTDLVQTGGTFNVTGGSGSGTNGVFTTSGTITYPGGYTGTMTVGGQTATVKGGRVVSVA